MLYLPTYILHSTSIFTLTHLSIAYTILGEKNVLEIGMWFILFLSSPCENVLLPLIDPVSDSSSFWFVLNEQASTQDRGIEIILSQATCLQV